ncbi:MAG: protein kinase [bacterium]|nr:protein kinase [bacterium]
MSGFPRIPGYTIESILGEGGMATVYCGIQHKLNRKVAIKILDPLMLKKEMIAARFVKEAETAANMFHSNIISIFDIGRVENSHYIVMEFLEFSLKDVLRKSPGGKLQPGEALSIIKRIAVALDYAHKEGIIHRDIKPDNIMFRRDGTPVLVDFGIARAMDSGSSMTRTGISVGTPHYMSPEQCKAEQIDGRSDFYSIGVVIHELLTGIKPYDADTTVGVALKHLQDPIPTLPASLDRFQRLVDSLMAKDRGNRVQNGSQLNGMIDECFMMPAAPPQPVQPQPQARPQTPAPQQSQPQPRIPTQQQPKPQAPTPPQPQPQAPPQQQPQPQVPPQAQPPAPAPPHTQSPPQPQPGQHSSDKTIIPTQAPDQRLTSPTPEPPPSQPSYPPPSSPLPNIPRSGPSKDESPSQLVKALTSSIINKAKKKYSLIPDKVGIPILIGLLLIVFVYFFYQGAKGSNSPSVKTETPTIATIDSGKTEPGTTEPSTQDVPANEETTENPDTGETTPEAGEAQYNELLTTAGDFYKQKNYAKAGEALREARNIKTTPELEKLAAQINKATTKRTTPKNGKSRPPKPLSSKDKNSDNIAFTEAAAKNTEQAYREYLEEFPSGIHIDDVLERMNSLRENKSAAKTAVRRSRKRVYHLRTMFRTLGYDDVETMIRRNKFFESSYNPKGTFKTRPEKQIMQGAEVIVDYRAGLMWHPGSPKKMKFKSIQKWLRNTNRAKYGGYSDWRLPTLEEAVSLLRPNKNSSGMHMPSAFKKKRGVIWTGDRLGSSKKWAVRFVKAIVYVYPTNKRLYIRPVRTIVQ